MCMKIKIFKYSAVILSVFVGFPTMAAGSKAGDRAVSVRTIRSEMGRNPSAFHLDGRAGKPKWNYTTGLELLAFQDAASKYGLEDVDRYVTAWADGMIKGGRILTYKTENYNLDHICPGRIYFALYDRTGKAEYKAVLDTLFAQLGRQPRTQAGPFWHKKAYPYQVWLDGLYMAEPFYAEYVKRFIPQEKQAEYWADIIREFTVAAEKTKDSATGLFRHAWDESRSMFWADKATGLSAHAWGRAMGWFAVALVDVLEIMPQDVPGRKDLESLVQYLADTLPSWSDKKTGMWYQVLDCPGREGNYLESTCSAMFTLMYLKAIRLGVLDKSYSAYAAKTYKRLLKTFVRRDAGGRLSLTSCCSVGGLGGPRRRAGDFAYYLSEPIVDNDCKGIGPLIWVALEIEKQ